MKTTIIILALMFNVSCASYVQSKHENLHKAQIEKLKEDVREYEKRKEESKNKKDMIYAKNK